MRSGRALRPSLFLAAICARLVAQVVVILTPAGAQYTIGAESPSSTRFSIEQHDATCWLLKPDGPRFFSLGVCCANQGASRNEWEASNPGHAAWQHYADSNGWALATLSRLKTWGFTTIGGWSERAEWLLSIYGSCNGIRGRIGAGMEPVFDEPTVRAMNVSGIGGMTRNIAALELPARLFGKDHLRRGDVIEFRSTFFTRCTLTARNGRVSWARSDSALRKAR